MQNAVQETNKAYLWLFVAYVLIVGILFSNLFIGIIIQTFQQTGNAHNRCAIESWLHGVCRGGQKDVSW